MTVLPPRWEEVSLGEVCERVEKWDPRKSPATEFDYVDIGAIDDQRITKSTTLLGSQAPSRARQLVRRGDTILSTVRTYLVNTALVPDELDGATVSTGFCVLRPTTAVDSKFLFYRVVESDFVARLSRAQTGSSYPAVRDSDVCAQRIELPPLAEQVRIVAAIEEQFSRLDVAERQLDAAEAHVGVLRRLVIDRALDGPWEERRLGELTIKLRNGVFVSRPASDPPGIPIFRISAVRPMALDLHDVRFALVEPTEVRDYFVARGDLLFTRYSGNPSYVGACAAVPELPRPTLHPDKLIRVTLDPEACLPEFVELAFASRRVRHEVESRLKTTAGQVGIAGSQLRSVPLPVPPIEEQARIADAVRTQLAAADLIAESALRARRRSSQLRRSILATAFRGDLVEQDSSDEPASVLLERIASERAAAPKPPRRPRERAPA